MKVRILRRAMQDIASGRRFYGRQGEAVGDYFCRRRFACALLLSPTIFRHEFLTFTHLATGYLRHITAPCETGREGPQSTQPQSGSHHESDQRRSRRGSIQTPIATDHFQVGRVTPVGHKRTKREQLSDPRCGKKVTNPRTVHRLRPPDLPSRWRTDSLRRLHAGSCRSRIRKRGCTEPERGSRWPAN